jgi:hypothetical protein
LRLGEDATRAGDAGKTVVSKDGLERCQILLDSDNCPRRTISNALFDANTKLHVI